MPPPEIYPFQRKGRKRNEKKEGLLTSHLWFWSTERHCLETELRLINSLPSSPRAGYHYRLYIEPCGESWGMHTHININDFRPCSWAVFSHTHTWRKTNGARTAWSAPSFVYKQNDWFLFQASSCISGFTMEVEVKHCSTGNPAKYIFSSQNISLHLRWDVVAVAETLQRDVGCCV